MCFVNFKNICLIFVQIIIIFVQTLTPLVHSFYSFQLLQYRHRSIHCCERDNDSGRVSSSGSLYIAKADTTIHLCTVSDRINKQFQYLFLYDLNCSKIFFIKWHVSQLKWSRGQKMDKSGRRQRRTVADRFSRLCSAKEYESLRWTNLLLIYFILRLSFSK